MPEREIYAGITNRRCGVAEARRQVGVSVLTGGVRANSNNNSNVASIYYAYAYALHTLTHLILRTTLCGRVVIIIPIWQMRKLKHKEVEW